MKNIFRPLLALMLVLSMGFSTIAFVGCSSGSGSASASAASAASDNSSASGEQDDCYGDDLPATKSDKS